MCFLRVSPSLCSGESPRSDGQILSAENSTMDWQSSAFRGPARVGIMGVFVVRHRLPMLHDSTSESSKSSMSTRAMLVDRSLRA
jgi:hypothetical protein